MNNQFICIGLQSFNYNDQINGFAIINIKNKDIYKIIKDLPLYSLSFNIEKNLLYTAMDEIGIINKNHSIIGIYQVVEGKDEIYLNNIYKFQSKHKDYIVSLLELKYKNEEEKENINQKIIIASSSIDCTLRINKISI